MSGFCYAAFRSRLATRSAAGSSVAGSSASGISASGNWGGIAACSLSPSTERVWRGQNSLQTFPVGLRRQTTARPYDVLGVQGSSRHSNSPTDDDTFEETTHSQADRKVSDRNKTLVDADEDDGARRRRVEAVLLLSKGPVSLRKLAQLAQVADATEARTHVRFLQDLYLEMGRAMRIELIAGGYPAPTCKVRGQPIFEEPAIESLHAWDAACSILSKKIFHWTSIARVHPGSSHRHTLFQSIRGRD